MPDKQVKVKVAADVDAHEVKDLENLLHKIENEGVQIKAKTSDNGIKVQVDDTSIEAAKKKTETITEDLEPIKPVVDDTAAQVSIQNIRQGFQGIRDSANEIGDALKSSLESAGKQETNKAFLEQALGDPEKAKSKLGEINNIVQNLPGDDSVIQGLLGQAAAKDVNLTTQELTKMGGAAADYFAAMKNYGKSSTEAFQDMNNYLLAGNTAEIERSPILANHIDKLKEGTTVQERSMLLQQALNDEHWGGISAQDTYNNKLETFNGMLERGQYNLGGMFQEGTKSIMDFALGLDESTSGMVGVALAAAGFASPIAGMVASLGQMGAGLANIGSLISAVKGLGFVQYFTQLNLATRITTIATYLYSAAQTILNMVMSANPIILVTIALIALAAAFIWAYQNVGWFKDMVDNAASSILGFCQNIYNGLVTGLGNIVNSLKGFWAGFVNTFKKTGNEILVFCGVIRNGWNSLKTSAASTASRVGASFNGMVSWVANACNGVTNAIVSPFRRAYSQVQGIVSSIRGAVNSVTGWISGSSGVVLGSSGVTMGGLGNVSSGNENIANTLTGSSGMTNIHLNGIIEESAGDFIVRKLNDELYKQRTLRGV